jgi:hypothetical protein
LVDRPLTIALNGLTSGYDPYLRDYDASSGNTITSDNDDGGNGNAVIDSLTVDAGRIYKIQVTSYNSIVGSIPSASYQLQASVSGGDVGLTQRNYTFGNSQTGQTVTFNGQLDGGDLQAPVGPIEVVDEYILSASVPGQPVTIALNSQTIGYNPYLQVVNADTGEVLADSDDTGSGENALIAPGQPNNDSGNDYSSIPNSLTLQGGVNYRIYVTSDETFPTNDVRVGQYQLQASVPQGEVTLTPRVTPPVNRNVYRFFNPQVGTHFYTSNEAERDSVINTLPQYQYEGPAFASAPVDPLTGSPSGTATGVAPVYRFFNTQVGVHFYTISAAERDNVINTLPQYSYEGVGYYAYDAPQTGSLELYRFFNTQVGVHFYTASAAERDNILSNLPQYNYEGVAYYVNPVV